MTFELRDLLPSTVEVEEAMMDVPVSKLLPEERAFVEGAVPERQAEFVTVRDCARRALTRLGERPAAILPGPTREPRWPAGIVGSLTHCEGYRAAAVARAEDVAALGIDAEPHRPLPEGIVDLIAAGNERGSLSQLAAIDPSTAWDRLLFSAKESIYKAWFTLAGTWLDFTECEVSVEAHSQTFAGNLLIRGPNVGARTIDRFTGRWAVLEHHIVTAVWEPAS